MPRHFGLSLFCFIGIPAALAQIDHRVNQGNANTAGYALDKNPQTGSGGFNLARPSTFDNGARANAIITGNVTGLGAFHGPAPVQQAGQFQGNLPSTTLTGFNGRSFGVNQTANQLPPTPVLQANQFRSDLPSTTLSGFDARSVGLDQVSQTGIQQQQFYFDPNRTIADTGQIRQGQNMPGSSQLNSTGAPPPFQSLNKATGPSPKVRDLADTRLQLDVPPTPYGIHQVPYQRQQKRPVPADSVAPAFKAASESSIFGTATPGTEIPGVDLRLDQIRVGPTWDELAKEDTLKNSPAGARTVGSLAREAGATEEVTRLSPPTQTPLPTIRPGEPMPLNGTPPANLGADRFTDLYSALRAADQLGVQNIGLQPTTPPAEPANAPPRSELIRKTSDGLNQLGAAARWAKDVLDSPVTTFVGRNENRLNEYMAWGEDAMKQGDYYKAARLFGVASTIDVVNPLPYLDRGHALAAAGDYISAVRNLEQGIRLFPHIAAFKLDLIALVGQRDVFDVRRADLEGRLAGREQYELRFLLGYLELYSGLADEGMKNLRTAAKEAPVDSPIASFADLVAGDRKLPDLSK